jgi:ATP-dependent Lon protease
MHNTPNTKKRLNQLKAQEEQKALKCRKRADLISLSTQNIPIIVIKENEYKELLDFSTSSLIYVSSQIKDCIYKSGHKQLGVVCFDPEKQNPFLIQEGVLVNICDDKNISKIFLMVQPKEVMLFTHYEKQKNLLMAKIFKYKEEFILTAKESLLLDECTKLAFTYLSKTDKEQYFIFLNKLIYIEKFNKDNRFKAKFLLFLSLPELKEIHKVFHGESNYHKLLWLKMSLDSQLKTSPTPEIMSLKEIPKDYLPCIVISEYDFNQNVSLSKKDFNQQMEDFKEIAEEVFNTNKHDQFDVILLNSCKTELKGLGIQALVSSTLTEKPKINLSARIKITDLILGNKIIYAKIEPVDDKLTQKQLVQESKKYRDLIPMYNKNIEYPCSRMSEYDFKESLIKLDQFLHNNSYEMMQSLKLPLFPILTLLEKFDLIKQSLRNKHLQKIEELNNEYRELSKQAEWSKALEASTSLLNCDPENSDYHAYRGRCYKRLGQYEEAISNYHLALTWYNQKKKGKVPPSGHHFAIGTCWFQLGNLEEAKEALDKVNKNDLCEFHSKEFVKYKEKVLDIITNGTNIQSFDIQNIELSIEKLSLPNNVRSYAKRLYASYQSAAESERYKNEYLHYLVSLLTLPWGRKSKLESNLKAIKQNLEKSHFGLTDVKTRILKSLVFSLRGGCVKPPILCLVGPPGVGKTSIANALAEALGRKCTRLPLGGMHDTSVIKGFFRSWGGAESGKILSLIKQVGSWNPVMILDEIDKISPGVNQAGVEGALLALLDSEQNSQFSDDYFDTTFDLSEVFFIATANSTEDISFPLLNRMEVINLSGYTDGEKLEIAKNYLIPKILEEAKATNNEITVPDSVIKEIIANYTREAGVRELERVLRSIVQQYFLNVEITEDKSVHLCIDENLLKECFSNKKISRNRLSDIPSVGKVTGLAYTAMGGGTISIEAMVIPGNGKIKATGKLGEVLKESIEVAYARSVADLEEQKIPILDISKKDIHIHLLEGATPKEGPSAGITIYAAISSLLSGKKVRQDIAMTGEIGLYGDVFEIGGLKEKLAAAARSSIKLIVIPEANQNDLINIPDDLKNQLEIKMISKASELLGIIFID